MNSILGAHRLSGGPPGSYAPAQTFNDAGQKSACHDKAEAGRLKNHFPYRERCRPQHNSPSCGSTADAKPFWSALYHLLTQTDTVDYEYRRPSIYGMSTRCIGSRMRGNLLKINYLVAREGVEPPTPAFSGLYSTKVSD